MGSGVRTRLISLGVLLVVLATGFVLGLAWDRRPGGPLAAEVEREVRSRDDDRRGDDRRGKDEHRGRSLIVDRVGLAPEQEERVDSIVEVHREEMKELQREFRAEYGPRHRALVRQTRDAIRSVLTPEQRTLYDSLLARHDRKDRARHHHDDDREGGAERDRP